MSIENAEAKRAEALKSPNSPLIAVEDIAEFVSKLNTSGLTDTALTLPVMAVVETDKKESTANSSNEKLMAAAPLRLPTLELQPEVTGMPSKLLDQFQQIAYKSEPTAAEKPQPTLLEQDFPQPEKKQASTTEPTQQQQEAPVDYYRRLVNSYVNPDSSNVRAAKEYEKSGDTDKAIAHWLEEQKSLTNNYLQDAVSVYKTHIELGRLFEKKGDTAKALEQYKAGAKLCDAQLDYSVEQPWKQAGTAMRLRAARALETQGKTDEALKAYTETIDGLKSYSTYSYETKNDATIIGCHDAMARIHCASGKPDLAIKELEKKLTLLQLPYGSSRDHQQIGKTNAEIAALHLQANRPEEAMKVYEKSLKNLEYEARFSHRSSFEPLIFQTYNGMSQVKAQQGKFDEAIALREKGFKVLENTRLYAYNEDPEFTKAAAAHRRSVADLYTRKGDHARAFKELEEERKIYQKTIPAYSSEWSKEPALPKIFDVQKEMIKCLERQGKPEEALKMQEQQLKLISMRGYANPSQLAACYQQIADGYESINKFDSAAGHRLTALAVLGEKHPDYAKAYSDLEKTYSKDGKDIREELAKIEVNTWNGLDQFEKIQHLISKLPKDVSIDFSPAGTKIATDDLAKLLSVSPGRSLELYLEDLLSHNGMLGDTKQVTKALMEVLKNTKEIKFSGDKIEIIRSCESVVTLNIDAAGMLQVKDLRLGKTVSFRLKQDKDNPDKLTLSELNGIELKTELILAGQGTDKPFKMDRNIKLSDIAITQKKTEDGKVVRAMEVGTGGDKPISFTLDENVSEENAKKYTDQIGKIFALQSAIGKGSGLQELLSTEDLAPSEKELFSSIRSLTKKDKDVTIKFNDNLSYKISQLAGSPNLGSVDPSIDLGRSISFRIGDSKRSLELANIEGINVSANDSIVLKELLGPGKLKYLYFGSVGKGERLFQLEADAALSTDLSFTVDSGFRPAPHSVGYVTQRIPGSSKSSSSRIKFDENGSPGVWDVVDAGYEFGTKWLKKKLTP